MRRLWHVPDLRSEWGDADGYYAVADTGDEARQLVLSLRERQWQESWLEHKDHHGRTEAEYRRWYFWGVHLKPDSPDPDTQIGQATEVVAGVVSVPFLGYTW